MLANAPQPPFPGTPFIDNDTSTSAVSWQAVFAGAAAAAALSLILLILGVGLGLSSISPWSYSLRAIGASTLAWLAFTQFAASGLGGYLAGRLRTKWVSVHTDEVYFRDTAHGLLAWSVATLLIVALVGMGVRAGVGGAVHAGAAAAGASASALAGNVGGTGRANGDPATGGPVDYYADTLLRGNTASDPGAGSSPGSSTTDTNGPMQRAEVARILIRNISNTPARPDQAEPDSQAAVAQPKLDPSDRAYLAGIVAKRSGIAQADAEQRVDDTYSRMQKSFADARESTKQAADAARKEIAHSALWMFVALLFGAFVASVTATFGGRQRDHVPAL